MSGHPRNDPSTYRSAGPGYRAIRRLIAYRPASRVMARVLPQLDRLASRLSRGQHTVTGLLSGLTVVELTTTGSRSGRPRMVRLLGYPVDEGFVVIASNFGRGQHPAWYGNLRAQPRAALRVHGRSTTVVAELATGRLRAQLWQRGLAFFPGWQRYQAWQQDREIGIFLLRDK